MHVILLINGLQQGVELQGKHDNIEQDMQDDLLEIQEMEEDEGGRRLSEGGG